MISLNAKSGSLNTIVPANSNDVEAWAFTLPAAAIKSGTTNVLGSVSGMKNLTGTGTPAKQTKVLYNQNQHEVGGEVKTDDLAFRMDRAGTSLNTTFTWYYDDYGFLLGVDEGSAVYGVITAVYAGLGTKGNDATDGSVKAIASVLYSDGTTGTEEIDYYLVHGTGTDNDNATDALRGTISDVMGETTGNGKQNVIQLWPAYDINNIWPMTETSYTFNAARPAPVRGIDQGTIYMAPAAITNTQAASGSVATINTHGTLVDNLFKFVNTTNDMTVAVEVAGGDTTYTAGTRSDNEEYTDFAGHWATTTQSANAKLYKTLAYVTDGTNTVTWLDADTQIIFRDAATNTLRAYTLATLPGDVDIATSAGTYKGHLFAVQIVGGVVNDVMIADNVPDSATPAADKDELLLWNHDTAPVGNTSGNKLELCTTSTGFQVDGATANGDYVDNIRLSANWATTNGTFFRVGTANGNPYTENTEAVYWTDDTNTPVDYHNGFNWELYGATVTVDTDDDDIADYTYRLTPNSKVYGIGNGMVLAEGATALEYLNASYTNDVTIVYDASGSVLEMYIQTDPNITPNNPSNPSRPTGPVSTATGLSTGGNARIETGSDVALSTLLKSGISDVVVYNSSNVVAGGAAGQIVSQLLYFPFVAPASQAATLTIKNSDGNPVYIETASTVAIATGGAYFFTVNFTGYFNSSSAYSTGAMSAGTYTFTIVSNGSTLSSGTFTLS